ncbi:MAG: hypothetical protein D3909_09930 [Candidatus Electrothrix sp. ATG1]|nr:hypothetical protein [Candidatus Electrothrix sp. ATG1]
MGVYMKVRGDFLESPQHLLHFVVSPPKGGEMGVYMQIPGDSLESPSSTFIFLLSRSKEQDECYLHILLKYIAIKKSCR